MHPTHIGYRRLCCSGWVVLAHLFAVQTSAQDSLRWLPDSCNAILAIDVAAAYRSPVAQQNQWAKRAAESFVSQEVFLPPSAKRVFVGARLDLNQSLAPIQQHFVMELKAGVDLGALAALTSNEVEPVGSLRGLLLSGGRYVVQPSGGPLLMEWPGGRQASLRWGRAGAAADRHLPPLLKSAAEGVNDQYPIVAALDLSDAVSLAAARGVLEDLSGSPLKSGALDAAARTLASVQGAVCRVHLASNRTAQCRVEFGESVAPLGAVALPLLQSVLNQWGASLEDTEGWKSRVDGHALVYEGELSATGLKRLISVVRPPVVGLSDAPASSATPAVKEEPPQTQIVAASRKYLKSVQHELDELRATVKRTRDNHALWFERAARTIDELPLKNIDDELQQFAARVSSSLRYQSQAERMSNIRTGTRLAQTQANTFYSGVGSYGEVYRRVPGGNAPAIQAEGNEASASVKFSEWKQIEDGLVQVRQSLTRRYNEDF